MKLSPIQPNYVTKKEFNERFDDQKEYMDTGFNKLGEQIDAVEVSLSKKIDEQGTYMRDGFDKVFKQIDAVETNLGRKIDLLAGDMSWVKKTLTKVAQKLEVL